MKDDLGAFGPGDELWECGLPVIVYMNRLQETASLEFTMATGAHLSVPISIVTATGLVKDLDMKLKEKI